VDVERPLLTGRGLVAVLELAIPVASHVQEVDEALLDRAERVAEPLLRRICDHRREARLARLLVTAVLRRVVDGPVRTRVTVGGEAVGQVGPGVLRHRDL
jgi:hypothetical protein